MSKPAIDILGRFTVLFDAVQKLRASEPKRALIHALEIVELGQRFNNPEHTAIGLRLTGVCYSQLNDPLRALPKLLEALALFIQIGNGRQVAAAQIELGTIYFDLGDYIEAMNFFEQSIATNERIGSRNGRLISQYHLANVHKKLRNYTKAQMYCLENLEIAEALDRAESKAYVLGMLGELQTLIAQDQRVQGNQDAAQNAFAAAEQHFEAALPLAEALGDQFLRVDILLPYANLNTSLGNLGRTQTLIAQALEIAQISGSPGQHAHCLLSLGAMHHEAGDTNAAWADLESAMRIFEAQGMKSELAQSHRQLAAVLRSAGVFDLALDHFERFHNLDSDLRSDGAEQRAQALAIKMDLERTRRESELHQLRSQELTVLNERLQSQTNLLDRQAREDDLTGLANRRHLEEYAAAAFHRARDRGEALTLVIADIDEFKTINDRFSHALGDSVLRIVANILRSYCRTGDLAARYGGEEFVLVLSNTKATGAWKVCERIRLAVKQYAWESVHPELKVTISLGLNDDLATENHERVLALADERLYEAKRSGRNCTRPDLSGKLQ